MSMGTESRSCERAREWASLRVDRELSELESALLQAHLGRCVACHAYVAECEAIALRLRDAELERLDHTVSLARVGSRRPLRLVQVGVAAALVAAAAGLGSLYGTVGAHPRRATMGLPKNAPLLAFDASPRGLPTTREAALSQRPPAPIPRSLALPDL